MQAENSSKVKFWRRGFLWGGICFLTLCLVLVVILFVALKIGVSSDFLATKIQENLNSRFGDKIGLRVSNARLLLDDRFHLNLESRDVGLEVKTGNTQIDKIGSIRIAVAALPLLQGKLHIAQIQLSEVNITLASGQSGNFLQRLPQDGVGRIDFDAVSQLIFTAFKQGMRVVERQNLGQIAVEDVKVFFPFRSRQKHFDLASLILAREAGLLRLLGIMRLDGQEMRLEGMAHYDEDKDDSHFQLQLNQIPLDWRSAGALSPYWEDGTVRNGYFRLKGLGDVWLEANQGGQDQKIRVQAQLPQGMVDLADVSELPARADIVMEHQLGGEGIQILPSKLVLDRVFVNIEGFFAALPPQLFSGQEMEDASSDAEMIERLTQAADIEGKYHFKLQIDEGGVSHPDAPDLGFTSQVNAVLAVLERRLIFNTFYFQTKTGARLYGQGSLRFAPPGEGQMFMGTQTPEAIFSVDSGGITMREVRRFWPFNVASAARRFVLRQVKAGVLSKGRLRLNLPLDFYDKGKPRYPLTERELRISGEFENAHSLRILLVLLM